jgi:hypothetical protein
MTNTLVGEIYAKIIEGTVDKSLIAFEEFGVSGSTLEELRQVRFNALPDTRTATFLSKHHLPSCDHFPQFHKPLSAVNCSTF